MFPRRLDQLSFPQLADVLPVRAKAYGDPGLARPEVADLFSRHYAWRNSNGKLVAALRVGFERFSEHLPMHLLPDWFNEDFTVGLVVGSRFFTLDSSQSEGLQIAKAFFDSIWRVELDRKTTANACVAREDLVPFYLRLGYFYVIGSGHVDARGRPAGVLVSFANGSYQSPFMSMFSEISHPRNVDDLVADGQLLRSYRQIKQLLRSEIQIEPSA